MPLSLPFGHGVGVDDPVTKKGSEELPDKDRYLLSLGTLREVEGGENNESSAFGGGIPSS